MDSARDRRHHGLGRGSVDPDRRRRESSRRVGVAHRVRPTRVVSALLVVAVLGSLLGTVGTLAQAVAPPDSPLAAPEASAVTAPARLGYVPLPAPCRAADTRIGGGTLGPGGTREFRVRGSDSLAFQGGSTTGCGVPAEAEAVEISITAVSPTGANGFLRAFPTGVSVNAAFLNYTVGRGTTNTGTVPINAWASLELSVSNFGGTVHLVVDVQGVFVPTGGANYVPLSSPCKAVDTRTAGGTISAAASRAFQVAGFGADLSGQGGPSSGCGVPDGADAVELAVTVVDPVGTGFVRVAPNQGTIPTSAFVNYTGGTGITNTGTVTLSNASPLDLVVQNLGGTVHVRIDVQGYFTTSPGQGSRYQPVVPCRTVDTRAAGGPLGPDSTRTFQTGGAGMDLVAQGTTNRTCGVPQRAAAVEASITAVSPTGTGFAQVAPAGRLPTATVLNFSAIGGITNTGSLPLSVVGLADLAVRNRGGSAAYLVDVLGYYDPLPDHPRSPELVDAGPEHSCQVVGGGQVRCWGENGSGQLGDGSVNDSWNPVTVPGLNGVVTVAAGGGHSCVLLADDTVRCWGANGAGQLGVGDTVDRSISVPVASLVDVVQVVTGGDHTCALRSNRTVRCWGLNVDGQLGDGTTTNRSIPVDVPGLANVVRLAASRFHTCAQLADGTARCWGANGAGEVGDGTVVRRTSPVAVSGLTGVVDLDVGPEHSCALLASGAVRCWGANGAGQLGDGTTVSRRTPVPVQGISGAVDLTVGGAHTCAALADGTARCWGDNVDHQLGDGTTVGRSTPTLVLTGFDRVLQLSAGGGHTCAVVMQVGFGEFPATECWGNGARGAAGFAAGAPVTVPTPLVGSQGFAAVEAGASHTCAVLVQGQVLCWGSNTVGQVGVSPVGGTESTPLAVNGMDGVVQLAAGAGHTCALRYDGTVWCWGDDAVGQLGDGAPSGISTAPVQVLSSGGPMTGIVELVAGSNHTCARADDGTVRCWGFNLFGQLGDGTTSNRTEATGTSGLGAVITLAAGPNHTCAMAVNLLVRCWGLNFDGQLGNGATGSTSTAPVTVVGLSTPVVGLTGGVAHSCAVVPGTSAVCWGANSFGQLGDGTTGPAVGAVTGPAGVGSVVRQVAAGDQHTCAVVWAEFASSASCWGLNGSGQLGRNSTATPGTTPAPVLDELALTLLLVLQVDGGSGHSCALSGALSGGDPTIGVVQCWGANESGQLGDGTLDQRSVARVITST